MESHLSVYSIFQESIIFESFAKRIPISIFSKKYSFKINKKGVHVQRIFSSENKNSGGLPCGWVGGVPV